MFNLFHIAFGKSSPLKCLDDEVFSLASLEEIHMSDSLEELSQAHYSFSCHVKRGIFIEVDWCCGRSQLKEQDVHVPDGVGYSSTEVPTRYEEEEDCWYKVTNSVCSSQSIRIAPGEKTVDLHDFQISS